MDSISCEIRKVEGDHVVETHGFRAQEPSGDARRATAPRLRHFGLPRPESLDRPILRDLRRLDKVGTRIGHGPLPTIRIPDIVRPTSRDAGSGDTSSGFDYVDHEVSESQAAHWNGLNEKQKLTLVLKADREGKDVRDYL